MTKPTERAKRTKPTKRTERSKRTEPTETNRSGPEREAVAAGPISRLRTWITRARVWLTRLPPLPGWWPLVACVLLGTVGGAAYGLLQTPRYAATGYVVVVPTKDSDPATALGFTQAYGRVATSGAVLQDARTAAGVPVRSLRTSVQSATSPDAPMIEITGTAVEGERAATIANAVARSLTRTGNASRQSTGVRLVLFSEALTPTAPASPSASLSTAVGASAGGLVGGLFLLVRPRGGRRAADLPVPAPAPEPWTNEPASEAVREAVKEKEGVR